jgi:hypothetical protein
MANPATVPVFRRKAQFLRRNTLKMPFDGCFFQIVILDPGKDCRFDKVSKHQEMMVCDMLRMISTLDSH